MILSADGAPAGRLDFHGGKVVGAACGELAGEKAFYALLAVREGTFEFDGAAAVTDAAELLPARTLLMEGMRRLDVVERLRRRFPAPARVRYQGGVAEDEDEAAVLAYLGPGSRSAGDIVAGLLVPESTTNTTRCAPSSGSQAAASSASKCQGTDVGRGGAST